jgi:hypothetical protein
MKLKFDIRLDKRLEAYIQKLPRGVARTGLTALAEWLIGNGQRGLKRYPPYKYITRRKAYGKPFVSDKQRRFVMAAIREGRIDPGVPHRTGNTQRGYVMVVSNRGYNVKIVNKTRGAVYTRHDTLQARLNKLAGWRKQADVIRTNIKGAIRHAQSKVNEMLRTKKGL